ncbi:MAG: endo-1,4-beta-xylanase [Promethearchaeota archaeon]
MREIGARELGPRRGAWAGILLLAIVNGSLVALLASPFVENAAGRWADRRLVGGLDEKIARLRKGPLVVTFRYANGTPAAGLRVNYSLVRHDFLFGCNFYEYQSLGERDADYEEAFFRLFNYATLPIYWRTYEPNPGEFPRDAWLASALDRLSREGAKPKLHPVAWRNPAGYPDWLPGDPRLVTEALEARVDRLTSLYGGTAYAWDVVNEPTHLPAFGTGDAFDYVNATFQRTRAGDPDGLLVLNDYGILGHDFGGGPFYRLVRRLLDAGAPVDAIGFQGREPRTDWTPACEVWATLDAYARLGLPIHVTEFCATSSPQLPVTNSWVKGTWSEEKQAAYVETFYKTCFAHPAVEAITYWDLYDGRSWVTGAGLLREDWTPKPAYEALDRLVNEEWTTRGAATLDPSGSLALDAFYGEYEILVPQLGVAFNVNHSRTGGSPSVLLLE